MSYGVIAFESTHDAMAAEKYLKERIPVVMMPTPRSITASCGISLRFDMADEPRVRAEAENLSGFRLYRMEDGVCAPLE